MKGKYNGLIVCTIVFDDNGLALRVLPNPPACISWIRKHYGKRRLPFRMYRCRAAVLREFDRQMQLGLSTESVIYDLLLYGGVGRNPPPLNTIDGKIRFKKRDCKKKGCDNAKGGALSDTVNSAD